METVRYEISTDPTRLDRELIHRFLSEESYWAKGRPREIVDSSIEHSMCFGIYKADGGGQVGFARVVTDRCTFAWLADVFVVDEHRKQGLGKRLVETILAHPELAGIKRWLLGTADAHTLYSRYGFNQTERFMSRLDGSGGEQVAECA